MSIELQWVLGWMIMVVSAAGIFLFTGEFHMLWAFMVFGVGLVLLITGVWNLPVFIVGGLTAGGGVEMVLCYFGLSK